MLTLTLVSLLFRITMLSQNQHIAHQKEKWALNRFRESAFPFCNADFHRSASFVSSLNLMAVCTLCPDLAPPASPQTLWYISCLHYNLEITTKDTYYTQRFSDNPTS